MTTRRTAPTDTTETYLAAARRYARARFNYHREQGGYYGHESHDVARALEDTQKRFADYDWHGVEGSIDPDIQYLNTGDTYAATILYYRGRFIVSSWGNIVESAERAS